MPDDDVTTTTLEKERTIVLVIKTHSGAEIRIPLDEVESITELEPKSGEARQLPQHPYIHREGVSRCAACWQPRTHPSHTDQAVHS
jgi:hypothetical protein